MRFTPKFEVATETRGRLVRAVFFALALVLGLAGWQATAQVALAQDQATQEQATAPASPGDDYVLGTGDHIRVTVFGHDDLSGQFQVGANGRTSLPLIGEVKASGLTAQEMEKEIVNRLQPDYLKNPQVSVEVLNYRPFYILGEVNQPGSYPYVNGMRVINAVALAGGYTYRADEEDLWVTRTNGKREKASPTTEVFPGDVIEVPERFF